MYTQRDVEKKRKPTASPIDPTARRETDWGWRQAVVLRQRLFVMRGAHARHEIAPDETAEHVALVQEGHATEHPALRDARHEREHLPDPRRELLIESHGSAYPSFSATRVSRGEILVCGPEGGRLAPFAARRGLRKWPWRLDEPVSARPSTWKDLRESWPRSCSARAP